MGSMKDFQPLCQPYFFLISSVSASYTFKILDHYQQFSALRATYFAQELDYYSTQDWDFNSSYLD